MKKTMSQIIVYLLTASISVASAFYLVTQFLTKAVSQQEASGEIPSPPPLPSPPPVGAVTSPEVGEQPPSPEVPSEEGSLSNSGSAIGSGDNAEAPPQDVSPEAQGGEIVEGEVVESEEGSGGTRIDESLASFLAPYNYDSENRRDPFKEFSPGEETPGAVLGSDDALTIGPLRPLQQFALDEIQLVGIIWDVEKPKAMFIDPNGKIHILGKDERIGRKNGYIATIREGEIVIVETVKVRGQLAFSTRLMRMPK